MMPLTYPNFSFDITYRAPDSRARLGTLNTPHGSIQTPHFIFCGTKASIKALNTDQVRQAGAGMILANTYHLMLQPGADLVEKMGGLHKFMRWDGPMLTDSGGFQIFAMGEGTVADELKSRHKTARARTLLKITEDGATFRSYLDGAIHHLTPESAMDIQRKLGPDFVVALDECTATHTDKKYNEKSMAMSHRWGDRSLAQFERNHNGAQAVYGVVQGGVYEDLRRESSAYTADRPYFGTAIGGAFGNKQVEFFDIVETCVPHVHPDRPIHLLGIGEFIDIFTCVKMGIDTFDCVSPTRIARHGWALMKGAPGGRLNLRNAKYRDDAAPLDANSPLTCSNGYSKAYLHHLIKAGEILAMQILAQHNVAVMATLMREIRAAIADGTLETLQKQWIIT
jgi:queuine tRNA-ribosyltransferase